MGTRKAIGPHIHSRRAGHVAERWILDARPAVVKWLEEGIDPRLVDLANAIGAITVGRVYFEHQDVSGSRAAAILDRIGTAMRRHPGVQVWEGVNEAFQHAGALPARASFDKSLCELAEAHGCKAAIGSFSVGTPELDDWRLYAPALRYAGERGHFIALHEYSSPALQWGVGNNTVASLSGGQWRNVDPATRPGVTGWFTLRYRQAIAAWRALGLRELPRIIFTEGGIDRLHPDQVPGNTAGRGRGYKDAVGLAPSVFGDYARQLRWLCERWAEDPLVAGGVDFGFADASGEWGAFDLSTDPAMLARVLAEMRQLEDSSPAPPVPTPPPADPPREPVPGNPTPRVTSAAGAYAIPAAGESPAQFAARAAGWPDAPWSVRSRFWRELKAYNSLQFDRIHAGRAYRLPWFEVRSKG